MAVRRYGPGLVATTLALALWLTFGRLLAPSPFPLLLAAVMFAAWSGGGGPGLLVTLLGALGSAFLYFLPAAHLSGRVLLSDVSQLMILVAVGGLISALSDNLLQARRRAEAAQRRADILAEASRALGTSLDYEATLRTVAQLAVPQLATWCVVDMLEENGEIRLIAVVHADPEKEALVRELRRRYPFDPAAPYGLPKVLRTGQPELYPEIPDAWRQASARDPEHLRIMRTLSSRSSMCVPLVARGRTLGAMTYFSADPARRYGPTSLALAEELASRCALALDNARLYREAREAVRVRDEFLASASHDLKNPLTAIRGYLNLARRQARRLDSAAAEPLLDRLGHVDAVAARMAALIDELLDVAHLQAGRPLQLERVPTDLVALAREAVAEQQLSSEHHHLTFESEPATLVGRWDTRRLRRAVDNLLNNAVKYSPEGGEVVVTLTHEQNADGSAWAVLRVRDQGVGIPAADLPYIFERYRRAENVRGKIAGSGIGLASARDIVEQHGGRIGVESCQGAGTTFTVRLPLVDAGSEAAARCNGGEPSSDSRELGHNEATVGEAEVSRS